MINEETLAQCRRGVVLINTSRGALVDAEALLTAIKARRVGAACLDVYEEESDLFFEDNSGHIMEDDVLARLISMPNVIVTSHQAFLTEEALENIAETTVNNLVCFFENGKCGRIPLESYATKTNRKRLTGAYSDKSPLVASFALQEDVQMAVYTTDGRCVVFSTAQLLPKTTRNTQGVAVMGLNKKAVLKRVTTLEGSGIVNQSRYRCKNLPSKGILIKEEDSPDKQISFEV